MNTAVSDAHHDVANIHAAVPDVHQDIPNANDTVSNFPRDISSIQPTVSEIRSDIANIHRDKLKSREGKNQAVSVTRALTVTEQPLTAAQTYARSVISTTIETSV